MDKPMAQTGYLGPGNISVLYLEIVAELIGMLTNII